GMIAGEALGVAALEVVTPELAVRLAVAQHVIRDDEDAVGHGRGARQGPRKADAGRNDPPGERAPSSPSMQRVMPEAASVGSMGSRSPARSHAERNALRDGNG